MNALVSPDVVMRHIGPQGRAVAADILLYVLRRGFYSSLSEAIRYIVRLLPLTPIFETKNNLAGDRVKSLKSTASLGSIGHRSLCDFCPDG